MKLIKDCDKARIEELKDMLVPILGVCLSFFLGLLAILTPFVIAVVEIVWAIKYM